MREIQANEITQAVSKMCQDANFYLGDDVIAALKKGRDTDKSDVAKQVLDQILQNAEIAASEQIPLCQDTGLSVIFIDLGQDVHIVVETNRGHNLGRIITSGTAEPNTGIPGTIGGYSEERVLRAPAEGRFRIAKKIGEQVSKGDRIGEVESVAVSASIDSMLRGLICPDSQPHLQIFWRRT